MIQFLHDLGVSIAPYVGIIGGILSVLLFIPQIRLTLMTKQMKFVAPQTYHFIISNDMVWAFYGILIDNPIIYIPNIIGVGLSIFLLRLKSKYG